MFLIYFKRKGFAFINMSLFLTLSYLYCDFIIIGEGFIKLCTISFSYSFALFLTAHMVIFADDMLLQNFNCFPERVSLTPKMLLMQENRPESSEPPDIQMSERISISGTVNQKRYPLSMSCLGIIGTLQIILWGFLMPYTSRLAYATMVSLFKVFLLQSLF